MRKGKKNAKTKRAGLTGAALAALGLLCIAIKALKGDFVDAEGVLHEWFFLLPTGFFLIFSGILVSAAAFAAKAFGKRGKSRQGTENNMVCSNITVKDGNLYFANRKVSALAEEYGTPLYLIDEERIRHNCAVYREAFKKHFPEGSEVSYASKAASYKYLYRIMAEEGLSVDVVSPGEIYTASEAGFDMSRAYFQGNNKTDADIEFAMDKGVGYFVADNMEEIDSINRAAGIKGIRQKILLRLTPGIDTHTYEANRTGRVDSKFGAAIETGQAAELTEYVLKKENIDLRGFHCHIGSQIFDEDVFERAAVIMLNFIAEIRDRLGYTAEMLDLGGGYGVRYVEKDPFLDIEEKIASVAKTVRSECEKHGLEVPKILMEPGRSIVADAGMTVYTAGTVKRIPGYKNYVSVDGGMPDNPRYALYGAEYTCLPADRMDEPFDMKCTLAGRCCEDGDKIQENIMLPSTVRRGDIIAVCTTGAYNYSMASNYNRVPRPPVVVLKDGESFAAVKRETLADLVMNDL